MSHDFIAISNLCHEQVGQKIKTSGFVENIKCGKKFTFIILRDTKKSIQCIIQTSDELKKISNESYVCVKGTTNEVKNLVKSCTVQNMEIQLETIDVLSESDAVLPFLYKDVSYTCEERALYDVNQISYHLCLDNKSLYLRSPQGYSFAKCTDAIMYAFRNYLRNNGFIEIKTPKLIEGSSEGGANCFTVDYFKKKACLAQSPQLYKQMCVIGGLKRVYEIGHVYRAEESNINRYLSEFVGLDLEMEVFGDYNDLISFIYNMLKFIFNYIETECKDELDTIQKYFPHEKFQYADTPVVYTHRECVDMLKGQNVSIDYSDDFNSENEKKLGAIVKELTGSDIFVCKDYPVSCRPFYTYNDGNTTKSYDFIIRGEEILSGAQRIHKYEDLLQGCARCNINPSTLRGYLESFRFGVPPHGGCGIGLERLMKSYFDMKDIRYFSMFPRDPNRLYP